MRIAIGSDHRGFSVKSKLVELLHRLNQEVVDAGPHSNEVRGREILDHLTGDRVETWAWDNVPREGLVVVQWITDRLARPVEVTLFHRLGRNEALKDYARDPSTAFVVREEEGFVL